MGNYISEEKAHFRWALGNEGELTLATFNVLADCFIAPYSFPYCRPEYKAFPYRLALFSLLLGGQSPDVLCLQEIDSGEGQGTLRGLLALKGYASHYQRKKLTNQGVLLAWNPDVLSAEKVEGYNLGDLFNERMSKRSKDNVAVEAILRTRSGKRLAVSTAHLHWDPREEQIKYQEMLALLEHYQKFSEGVTNKLLCGDFNSLPESNTMALAKGLGPDIYRVEQEYRGEVRFGVIRNLYKQKKESVPWKDLYEDYPQPTNITARFTGRIDHVLLQGKSEAVDRLEFQAGSFQLESGLPCSYFPSDHLPLAVRLVLASE